MSRESYLVTKGKNLLIFWQFIKERFDPISHFIMITLFLLAHYLILLLQGELLVNSTTLLLLCLVCVIFFLKLRFYDEIKDYQTDLEINPGRPLPRGLISLAQVKEWIINCLVVEFVIFASTGPKSFLMGIMAMGYSVLMYKEFFIGEKIRPHLTTYATSHTIVTLFLSLALFCGATSKAPWELDKDYYYFGIASWLLFNIFELGRKTYQNTEERNAVESYSKIWGRLGAFVLVLIQGLLASYFFIQMRVINDPDMISMLIIPNSLLILSGVLYYLIEKEITGKIYRAFSSFYIVLIYLILIVYYFRIEG